MEIHESYWTVSIIKYGRLQTGSSSWYTHMNYADIIKRKQCK